MGTGLSECAIGHKVRGRHVEDCAATDCKGCLPAVAFGQSLYCVRHIGLIHMTLLQAPDLVSHIREHIEPGSSPPGSSIKRTKGEAPAPLNVSAMSDADDLHAALVEIAELVMDERHLAGPAWSGTDVRPAAKRRTEWGAIVYEPARAAGVKDTIASSEVASWLIPHEEWLGGYEGAVGAIAGLLKLAGQLRGRWPIEVRPQHLPTPCPTCDRLSLYRYAPKFAGLPVAIACAADDCQTVIKDELYAWHTRRLVAEKRAG